MRARCWIWLLLLLAVAGCSSPSSSPPEMILYLGQNASYVQPILQDWEKATGIHVVPRWDVEPGRSAGLGSLLAAEGGATRCPGLLLLAPEAPPSGSPAAGATP